MIQPGRILLRGLLLIRIVESVLPFSRYSALAKDPVCRACRTVFSFSVLVRNPL